MAEPNIPYVIIAKIKKDFLRSLQGQSSESDPDTAERHVSRPSLPGIGFELILRARRTGSDYSVETLLVSQIQDHIDGDRTEVHVYVDKVTMGRLIATHGFRPCSS